jgi:hypothetical protein
MTVNQLFKYFEKGFSRRRFSAGLLVAFIDFLKDLDAMAKTERGHETPNAS